MKSRSAYSPATAEPRAQVAVDPLLRERIITAAAPLYGNDGCHGLDHALRVERNALALAAELGARANIVSMAALLHDIGRRQERESRGRVCHAETGAREAAAILVRLGVAGNDIETVAAAIKSHRFRNRHDRPQGIEAEILFDADKLDSLGAVGIGRAFLFAGQVGARLHNSDVDIEKTSSYSREDTAWREYEVKLKKIPGRMLTRPGREEAFRRRDFMEGFFRRLDLEIYGETG